MATPKFGELNDSTPRRIEDGNSHKYALAIHEDGRRTARRSRQIPTEGAGSSATSLRPDTLDVIGAVYEDAMGYRYDFDRVIASFGFSRQHFPRKVAGQLLIELSKRLHPGRRPEFLRTGCETLHQFEGTPRIFV